MTSHAFTSRTPAARPHRYAGGAVQRHPSRREPWSVVARHDHGQLRYARARGVVTLAVGYATWGHRLVLQLPPYNDASHFLDRADVALDVDASRVGRVEIVRVSGLALSVASCTVPTDVTDHLECWPPGLPTSAVVIVPELVEWLPAVDDVRFPPLPAAPSRLPATFAG